MKQEFGLYANIALLDDRSTAYARLFAANYPEWVKYASIVLEDDFGDTNYLYVEVPAPIATYERDLLIVTNSRDLTVHFDKYHAHFGRFGLEPAEAFKAAGKFIQSILKEELVVYSYMKNGGFGGAGCVDVDKLSGALEAHEMIHTRSWLGTYDKKYEP